MLSLPLSFFVIIYALFALVTLSFAFINIYHIVSTGTLTLLSFSLSAFVVLLMIGIIAVTGIFVGALDLSQGAVIFESVPVLPSL
ncbi:MAG: hypothetical protein AAB633_02785 [Patescibacteria group bacterium]